MGLTSGLGRPTACAIGLADRTGPRCERILAELPELPELSFVVQCGAATWLALTLADQWCQV